MDRLLMLIATGGGSGYLPMAPGTWGSAAGVLLWLGLGRLAPPAYGIALLALFLIGVFSAGAAEKILDRSDPGAVVIDEIVGQLIVLALAPAKPWVICLGFLFFRFFDIIKPFPANWVDSHIHGGLGIMLDDVIAGLYGLAALQMIIWIFKP